MARSSLPLLLAVLVGASGGYVAARSGAPAAPASPAAPAPDGAAASPLVTDARDGESRVVGPGRVEPISGELDLAADVPGVMGQVLVKEGDRVAKGQILAELVNRDVQARVEQTKATIQVQTARLEKLRKGARPEERKQAQASVQEQNALAERLRRDLERQKILFRQGYASNAQLEQAQSSYAAASARRRSASEGLAQLDAGARSEDLATAEAELALAKAQFAEAGAQLERTRIRAPIDGVVLRLHKRAGEAVSVGGTSPILQMGDLSRLVVRTQIDEADIGRIARLSRAYATAPAFPGRRFPGSVTEISPRLGAKTISTGLPTEKRDASVLDVLVTLDPGTELPVGLRVDCFVLDGKAGS